MGSVRITISSDRLSALLELDDPVPLSDVEREIEAAGIVHGLLLERIQDAMKVCRSLGKLPRPVCIAEGTDPVPGVPSRFDLLVELGSNAGAVDQDSSQIDYRERGGVCNVSAGQELGAKIPGVPGEPGVGVDGKKVQPPMLDDSKALIGEGIVAGEAVDGRIELTSAIDGILRRLPDGELVVVDKLEINGDVDMSVGNLDVNGSVVIHGSILSGFRVVARRHITVDLLVEDAWVEAGGSVNVGRGVIGGEEGAVIAGGSVRLGFGQNANIRCQGDVVLESDTRSRIESGGKIIAREGGGRLIGGLYWAGKGITVRDLGSSQGVATIVTIGSDPATARELSVVRKELRSLRARTARESEQTDHELKGRKVEDVRAEMRRRRELGEKENLLQEREAKLVAALELDEAPTVRVDGLVYPGVEIRIQKAHLFIDQPGPGGIFRLDPQAGKIVK